MNDVKNTLKQVEWTSSIRKVDKLSAFPMMVKPTPEIAEKYKISENPLLLHHFWVTQRLVAQSVEDEGAYVVGPQMEISADYTGTFQYRHDQKGNSDLVQIFMSVKEIASAMPERVFPQDRLVVYPATTQEPPANGEKMKSIILQPREQLTVISKEVVYTLAPVNRAPFGLGGKHKFKQVLVPCVAFLNEATQETINLPLTTKGYFATLSCIPAQGREFDFRDIINEIDLPINLTTCRNCPQTLSDEHFLRPGMRLRITAVEEHQVILGITTQEKIVEFASDGGEFIVPKYLECVEDREQEIAYQTALQRFLMECQIKNSPVNIKDYRKSIRNHISRTIRPTNPKAISQIATNRSCKFARVPLQNGVPAIAFLSSSINSGSSQMRRSSLPNDRPSRPPHPLPPPASGQQELTPPLPPRNSRMSSSLRGGPRPFSVAFPDFGADIPPQRAPPPPPLEDLPPVVPERPKSHSAASYMDSKGQTIEPVWGSPVEIFVQTPRNTTREPPFDTATNLKDDGNPGYGMKPSDSNLLDNIERPASPEFQMNTRNIVLTDLPTMRPSMPPFTRSAEQSPLGSSNELPAVSLSAGDSPTAPDVPLRTTSDPLPSSQKFDDSGGRSRPSSYPETPKAIGDFDEGQQLPSVAADGPGATQTLYENFQPLRAAESSGSPEQEHDTSAGSSAHNQDYSESASLSSTKPTLSRENSVSSYSDKSSSSSSKGDFAVHDVQISMKESPAISRTSSKRSQKNGFHVSRYSVVSDDSNPSQQLSFACNYLPSPKDWIPPDDVSEMSVEDVANSMRYIGMTEDTVEWFRAEKVDGQLLCSIEDVFITEHFRLTAFQRKKLVMFLKGWRPKLK